MLHHITQVQRNLIIHLDLISHWKKSKLLDTTPECLYMGQNTSRHERMQMLPLVTYAIHFVLQCAHLMAHLCAHLLTTC